MRSNWIGTCGKKNYQRFGTVGKQARLFVPGGYHLLGSGRSQPALTAIGGHAVSVVAVY